MMPAAATAELPVPVELEVVRHRDERGFFSETWNPQRLAAAGIAVDFVQDNHAYSAPAGVLRGLHFQLPPHGQDKLVRVARGSVFCVAVDIRRSSPGFRTWRGFEVSARKWNQVFVPKGFAFGYLTLEDDTDFLYKVSAPYSPTHERNIRFDDPDIGIEWPVTGELVVSPRDLAAPRLAGAEVYP